MRAIICDGRTYLDREDVETRVRGAVTLLQARDILDVDIVVGDLVVVGQAAAVEPEPVAEAAPVEEPDPIPAQAPKPKKPRAR